MREIRTSGTVRGVPGNRHSYRGVTVKRREEIDAKPLKAFHKGSCLQLSRETPATEDSLQGNFHEEVSAWPLSARLV